MIQNIFLPKKIGSYYLFRQRTVGIDITKTHIHASLVIARGATIKIAKQVSVSLQNDQQQHNDRVVATLPSVYEQIGSFDQIVTALPSALIVFKELRLPFTTRDKISMVIHFEVAPLLPFPPQEAVLDFIITSVNEEEKNAQVLVAAAQKKHIAEHLALFEQAGRKPDKITVDMFALYGLYNQIPAYRGITGSVALIDLTMQHTNIVSILDTHLRIIRTLPYGIATVAKDAGNASDLKPQQVMDHLLRFGLTQGTSESNNQAIQNSITAFFHKIQFALTSTFNQLQTKGIDKILLCGPGAEIKDIVPFAEKQLGSSCELLDLQKITENKQYRIAPQVTLSQPTLLSTATALPTPAVEGFNLLQGEFAASGQNLLLKQLITAGVLIVLLFSGIITQTIIQSHRLNAQVTASEQEAVEALKERFPEIPEEDNDLDEVLRAAQTEFNKEEVVWRAFSSQHRISFLAYLLELTSRINKQDLGFVPEQISIVDGVQGEITLKAKVKDHPALVRLEQALRESKLFSYVEGQSDTSFTMKILASRNI